MQQKKQEVQIQHIVCSSSILLFFLLLQHIFQCMMNIQRLKTLVNSQHIYQLSFLQVRIK